MCPPAPAGCGRIAIVAEPLEALIVEDFMIEIESKKVRDALRSSKRSSKRRDDDGDDITELERELEALASDYGEGRVTRREWLAARTPLERRRDQARLAVPDQSTRSCPENGRQETVRSARP